VTKRRSGIEREVDRRCKAASCRRNKKEREHRIVSGMRARRPKPLPPNSPTNEEASPPTRVEKEKEKRNGALVNLGKHASRVCSAISSARADLHFHRSARSSERHIAPNSNVPFISPTRISHPPFPTHLPTPGNFILLPNAGLPTGLSTSTIVLCLPTTRCALNICTGPTLESLQYAS